MLVNDGIPTGEDLAKVLPSAARLAQGPCSIVECFQHIPCNPCVEACPRGAISITGSINGIPVVDYEKCNGCGLCIASCPGLAIFGVDMTYGDTQALVAFPYEYCPLPAAGEIVTGLDRAGQALGRFEVARVNLGGKANKTATIYLKVPKELAMEVRSMKVGDDSACPTRS